MELRLGRSDQGHFPYFAPRSYEIQVGSLSGHWNIAGCSSAPDAQQMDGSEIVDGYITAQMNV